MYFSWSEFLSGFILPQDLYLVSLQHSLKFEAVIHILWTLTVYLSIS